MSEGPHERFIAGQTRKLEAQRALADAKVAAFNARDPITTAHKLAQADAKRARKNAKRLYVRDVDEARASIRKMKMWERPSGMWTDCRRGRRLAEAISR